MGECFLWRVEQMLYIFRFTLRSRLRSSYWVLIYKQWEHRLRKWWSRFLLTRAMSTAWNYFKTLAMQEVSIFHKDGKVNISDPILFSYIDSLTEFEKLLDSKRDSKILTRYDLCFVWKEMILQSINADRRWLNHVRRMIKKLWTSIQDLKQNRSFKMLPTHTFLRYAIHSICRNTYLRRLVYAISLPDPMHVFSLGIGKLK